MTRYPFAFPQLEINPDVTDIEKFTFKDFKILNYKHHPKIKMEMAV